MEKLENLKICCSLLDFLKGEKREEVIELAELFWKYLESKEDICKNCKYDSKK